MKRLKPTDKIREKLAAALGTTEFDIEKYAVFETIAINDLPVSKAGSLYDGSVMTKATLQAMVDQITQETFLPLHTLHRQGNELPVGRVFHAELHPTTNKSGRAVNEVRALFYVPLSTDQGRQLADGIDTGIINEVSIGARPAKLMCSVPDCHFDYMGANVSFMNWLDRTCSNDHTVGKDGVHVVFDGLKKLFELSLVSLGAADHARIQAPDQAIAAAANDDAPEYQLLYATKGKEKETDMKLTPAQIAELKAELQKDGKAALDAKHTGVTGCMSQIKEDMTFADAQALRELFKAENAKFTAEKPADPVKQESGNLTLAEVIDLKADLKIKDRQIADLQAQLGTKDTSIATLTTENTGLKTKEVQLNALTAEVTPVKDFLKAACQNLLVAAGVANPTIPESLSELVASIKVSQAKLSKLPTGGLLLAAEAGSAKTDENTTKKDSSSFKVKP